MSTKSIWQPTRSGINRGVALSCLALWLVISNALSAGVEFRVSIKVILGPGGEFPNNPNTIGVTGLNLNSVGVIRTNIDFSNTLLARHGVGYRLVLRENQIYTLSGFDEYWFTNSARTEAMRDQIEIAATHNEGTKAIWKWHDDSINIYLNDSRSGFCSTPGSGRSAVVIGAGAYQELIIHEIGHFFSLAHTHIGDNDGSVDNWGNGDGLADTLDDEPDATAAQINDRYDGNPLPFEPQEVRNDLILNIMSYHLPQDRLTWGQRELLIETFNHERAYATVGRARFVQSDGNDGADGLRVANRLRTIGRGVNVSASAHDLVLIRGGSYSVTAQGLAMTLNRPVTLSAWRGPVTLTR